MSGPSLPAMAWRNIWRQRRRTLLTLSSIAFGTMCAVIFTGIGDSNFSEMIDLAARMGGGHVTIQHEDYLDSPTLANSVRDVAALRTRAEQDPLVEKTVTRIIGHVMLATAGQSYGAGFIALDPKEEDASTLSLLTAISEGEMFSESDESGIILGARLAENLKAGLGRKIVYTLTDKAGEIVYGVARVSAIIETGAPTVDAGLSLLPLDRTRKVLGYEEDESALVALYLSDQRRSDLVADRLRPDLPTAAAALPWHQSQPELSGFITMKVVSAQIMEIVIMLLVAAGIFNTIFVSVMERLREFGVLLAIGLSPGSLFALIMWESLWLALLGLVAAALVTAWPYYFLATTGVDISALIDGDAAEVAGVAITTVMRVGIYPENLIIIAFAALSATLLSGIYPAWKAAHVEPVEAIRLA